MKILEQMELALRTRPDAAASRRNRNSILPLRSFLGAAAGAILACGPATARAAEAVSPNSSTGITAAVPGQVTKYKSQQMRRYQAFARQAELPPVTVISETMVTVGTTTKINTLQLPQISARDIDVLAGEFGVPSDVIAKVMKRTPTNDPPGAIQLVQQLRTAVIDYRFLQGEWSRYQPPAEARQSKADALQALQNGDLAKAWTLYDQLGIPSAPGTTPPQPPANLRLVDSP